MERAEEDCRTRPDGERKLEPERKPEPERRPEDDRKLEPERKPPEPDWGRLRRDDPELKLCLEPDLRLDFPIEAACRPIESSSSIL